MLEKDVQNEFKPFRAQKGARIQVQAWLLPYARAFLCILPEKYKVEVGEHLIHAEIALIFIYGSI